MTKQSEADKPTLKLIQTPEGKGEIWRGDECLSSHETYYGAKIKLEQLKSKCRD
jgi:hypothetical protein